MTLPTLCPCGSTTPYSECCGLYHSGAASVPTAEALMRSRYSAFAMNKMDYILATQRLEKGQVNEDEVEALDNSNALTNWTRLEILATEQGQTSDNTGTVTFRAYFKEGMHQGELNEKSWFRKEEGQWLYIGGEHDIKTAPLTKTTIPKQNVGRNDPCSCGSGKKFKKCCG
ncbi:hypothetical protein MSP8887_02850 [Marinomonas spartinae]|uniref:YchJ-like middle NTF2-like domain-containing protein n=1 Tax=Marinomonas spartinae TaxID=1792290 RepID=A0A1A8TC86_9GAMM|nr:YchJ family protein [Marinomonas spartinae]SBS29833.1 hypothetical protein MSP8886_01613 [Marinomonas spartinae]SBS37234.1 hypothetical protein MSP8887_02850 [Marinomonas spartinae]